MLLRSIALLVGLAGGTLPALSQTFPTKPIRMVAPEPGGGTEFAARIVAQGLSANMGQQVVVESRPGGGGAIAADYVAKAAPDGHTLLYYGTNIWLLPFLRDKVPYDPLRDFAPITLATRAPNVLTIHPSLPVKSVKELISLARAQPGDLNYGSAGSGSATHMAAELFKSMANVNIVRIPYKGTAAALNDLLGGRLHLMFTTIASVKSYLGTGKLKMLAVASPQRSALIPDLPTVADTLPGYESGATTGVFAPSATPQAIVERLHREFIRVLEQPDVKEKLLASGVEVIGNSSQQFSNMMKSEMMRMGKLIKEAGIREE